MSMYFFIIQIIFKGLIFVDKIKKWLVLLAVRGLVDAFSFKITKPESVVCLMSKAAYSEQDKANMLNPNDYLSNFSVKMNTPFLMGLFSLCYLNAGTTRKGVRFSMKVNNLKKYLSLSSGGRGFDVVGAVKDFESVYGYIEGQEVLSIVSDIAYDAGVLSFDSVYFAFLIYYMETQIKAGPMYCSAIRADIASGRFTAAKEIAVVLANIVARKSKGVCSISLNRLLQRCPTFGARFKELSDSEANRYLKRTLEDVKSAFRTYCFFKGAKVSIALPSTINRFELRHEVYMTIKKVGGSNGGSN